MKRVVPLISMAALALYPCVFLYFQNVSECSFLDVMLCGLVLLLIGGLGSLLLFAVMRSFDKAVLTSNIFMLLFANFVLIQDLITKFFVRTYYWHVLIFLAFVVLTVGALIKNLLTAENAYMANGIVGVTFGVLILINGIFAVPYIVAKLNMERSKEQLNISTEEREHLPNIYFMVFDEYGGTENLKHYCGYDNTGFYSDLRKLGFNVSEASENEAYYTGVVMTNLLNLDYVGEYSGDTSTTDWTTLGKLRENPVLFQILLRAGYKLNMVDADNFLDASNADFRFTGVSASNELSEEYIIFSKTALYPLFQKSGDEDLDILNDMFAYIQQAPSLQKENLWTMAYFSTPHDPWFVNADGTPLNGADRSNWENPNIYLGQLKYLNKKIIEAAESIIRQDPNCIIVLQSDHGWRPGTILKDKYPDLEKEAGYMRNILNAVYYQNTTLDIEGLSGINTLRTVLNTLLGLDLPALDPSEYKGH